MANIHILKKIINGIKTSIYPVTIPQAVIDPADGKSLATKIEEVGVSFYEINNNLSQLAGDVNLFKDDVNLKDAVQDNKIKDIENVLSTANINQATTLSVMGRKVISLPKNASNGGMQVKLEGLTAENLVVNGDFRNGITGWNVFLCAPVIFNNILSFIPTAQYARISIPVRFYAGNAYYISAKIATGKTNISYGANAGEGQIALPNTSGVLTKFSNIFTPTVQRELFEVVDKGLAPFSEVKIDTNYGLRVINLTKTFGPGNEITDIPTLDAMFSDYFEGVKSFETTGRVRSVGKNLFNSTLEVGSLNDISGLPEYVGSNGVRSKKFIGIIPNTQYSLSNNLGYLNLAYWYDSNENYIARTTSPPYISPINAANMKIRTSTAGTQNDLAVKFQLEKATAATQYEPYKETNLYLTAPELRSNGAVKDEIRKGANGYELVKRVGVGVTYGNDVAVNGSFTNGTTGWTLQAAWSYGDNNIIGTFGVTGIYMYGNTSPATRAPKHSVLQYTVVSNNGNGALRVSGANVHSTSVSSVTKTIPSTVGTHRVFLNPNRGVQYNYTIGLELFGGTSGAIVIDNLSLKDVSPIQGIISDTSTFTELSDGTVLYTLASPEIITISYGGVLNSAESGTVYHEPIVADAGVYGTNMPILLTDYPIETLEEIIVHNDGIDTYLDVSTAVIAGDGLSFTHPSLGNGDLVLFTYAYSKESTNGQMTATFFDSNVVKIDTVTGKAYKITDVVTSGVLTRTLTEV